MYKTIILPKNSIDITGFKYGRINVLRPVFVKNESTHWECKCDCGKSVFISGASLRRKKRPTISCGCLQKEAQALKKGSVRKRKSFAEYSLNRLEHAISISAKERKIDFNISKEEIANLVFKNCYYCNKPPSNCIKSNRNQEKDVLYNGLDRINSSLGYNHNNVVPCCKTCNLAKHIMSQEEFYIWIKNIYANLTATGKFNHNIESNLDFSTIWDNE